jgi:plasmid maintenance system antidote protein VapI
MKNLEIAQEANTRCSIRLSPAEGEQIRQFIIQNTNMTFNRYVEQIGMQVTNVANYLSGRNPLTVGTLSKLLAGTNLKFQCHLQILISTGHDVSVVDYTQLEEMLQHQDSVTCGEAD